VLCKTMASLIARKPDEAVSDNVEWPPMHIVRGGDLCYNDATYEELSLFMVHQTSAVAQSSTVRPVVFSTKV
jgi:hypothetical protein